MRMGSQVLRGVNAKKRAITEFIWEESGTYCMFLLHNESKILERVV